MAYIRMIFPYSLLRTSKLDLSLEFPKLYTSLRFEGPKHKPLLWPLHRSQVLTMGLYWVCRVVYSV